MSSRRTMQKIGSFLSQCFRFYHRNIKDAVIEEFTAVSVRATIVYISQFTALLS
jgi:hypothetical protein